MATFRDPNSLQAHIEKALADLHKSIVVTAQAELGQITPRDTGRLRSSWFAQVGSGSNEVAPEGKDSPNTDAQQLPLQFKEDIYLTNNLPYAQPIALGVNLPPSWNGVPRVKAASQSWFYDFRQSRLPKIRDEEMAKIKRRYGL